jgi:S-adenosylmethionine:tRNA ribosyltransferase-isomerase
MDSAFRLSTYDYPLDKSRIAQFPLKQRDHARLAVLHRSDRSTKREPRMAGRLEHRLFFDLPQYLRPGDVLVLNDTRVLPARLMARKRTTGGRVEILLVRISLLSANASLWEVMIKGSVTAGQFLDAGPDLEIRMKEQLQNGCWLIELTFEGALFDVLDRLGQPPLPPYIRRAAVASDREDYQTIYAKPSFTWKKSVGSVAAPTAGLHFTEVLLDKIRAQGVRIVFITLHIGPGTFRPVRSADVRQHTMEPEYYEISKETVRSIEEARSGQGRIIAVGTSTTRALEAAGEGTGLHLSGVTDLFIFPGYRFKLVQGLITNFHMPQSTLLMLVSAFAGIDALKELYDEAIRMDYRFLSFGDAMMIL